MGTVLPAHSEVSLSRYQLLVYKASSLIPVSPMFCSSLLFFPWGPVELPYYDSANILGMRKERVVTKTASTYNEDQGSFPSIKTNLLPSFGLNPICPTAC